MRLPRRRLKIVVGCGAADALPALYTARDRPPCSTRSINGGPGGAYHMWIKDEFLGPGNKMRLLYLILPIYGYIFLEYYPFFPWMATYWWSVALSPPIVPTHYAGEALGRLIGDHVLFGITTKYVYAAIWLGMAHGIILLAGRLRGPRQAPRTGTP
ncbi:hypothetical protein CENSYa_1196 [Cenarchaeum symbiosum A]|uniref:Uncharacterized protein n=1 Tax=Cenarchaeum symbiosum (strain A) TaxID=414004 RepID=A0RWV3_CENSY|nr:hypothetical protein CENSYa_1196 [Cenarchaeum symbiosum A]